MKKKSSSKRPGLVPRRKDNRVGRATVWGSIPAKMSFPKLSWLPGLTASTYISLFRTCLARNPFAQGERVSFPACVVGEGRALGNGFWSSQTTVSDSVPLLFSVLKHAVAIVCPSEDGVLLLVPHMDVGRVQQIPETRRLWPRVLVTGFFPRDTGCEGGRTMEPSERCHLTLPTLP